MAEQGFPVLAEDPEVELDDLALALAAEFRTVDPDGARARLEELGAELEALGGELDAAGARFPTAEVAACAEVLGERHGFRGDAEDYDNPDNSMLDVVLERRRGLPILLSVVYVEVARRAGVPLACVGLPGHFVVGHFGAAPPPLLDPFNRGAPVVAEVPPALVRPWSAHETALRMLNNLVSSFARRSRLDEAIRAARLRLALPVPEQERQRLGAELLALEARLN